MFLSIYIKAYRKNEYNNDYKSLMHRFFFNLDITIHINKKKLEFVEEKYISQKVNE